MRFRKPKRQTKQEVRESLRRLLERAEFLHQRRWYAERNAVCRRHDDIVMGYGYGL
mgnify:CR=1 FL=1